MSDPMTAWLAWLGASAICLTVIMWFLHQAFGPPTTTRRLAGRCIRRYLRMRQRYGPSPRWHRIELPPLDLTDRPKDERT